jgi:hypothetical protein
MSVSFCTQLELEFRRFGSAKKAAVRLAGFCCLVMLAAYGLLGIFFLSDNELPESIPGAGTVTAGSRTGTIMPALFAIRR